MIAVVDSEDYELVTDAGKWSLDVHQGEPRYARRTIDGRTVLMHTFITGFGKTDHRNGQGLDNRRSNLRPATPGQNVCNQGRQRNNTSGFKGVYSRGNRWRAAVTVAGMELHLGYFGTPKEAALAYDHGARELHGEFAFLNFPEPHEIYRGGPIPVDHGQLQPGRPRRKSI